MEKMDPRTDGNFLPICASACMAILYCMLDFLFENTPKVTGGSE